MRLVVDVARVDLGAAHNGRVTVCRVYQTPNGTRYILDEKGHRFAVLLIDDHDGAHINYVVKGDV